MRTTYLVCYDVTQDRRRNKVFRACKDYGVHLQFSVFECDLNAAELAAFQRELVGLIHAAEDQVLFVRLGPAESRGERVISALGRPCTKLDSPCYVV